MNFLALLSNFGGPDLIIILLIVLVLFGAKKLPELAKGMGQAVKEFQKAKDEFSDELHSAGHDETAKSDVRPAQATVPRIENAVPGSPESAVHPDPAQANTVPGDQSRPA